MHAHATPTPQLPSAAIGLPAAEEPGLPDLRDRADEAAALLKALANPDRLLLLCQLVVSDCSVGELGRLTGLLQPSLSQQLGVLRGERLVATRREGKQVVYRIVSPAAAAVLGTLHGLYCKSARVAHGRSTRRTGSASSKLKDLS